jgi:nuclear cap-binding protein subunit 1
MVAVAADVVEVRWLRAWSVYSNVKYRADDYDHYDHRREAQESPDQKLKTAIIKFGEVVRFAVPQACSSYRDATQDAEQELPQLADKLRSQEQPSIPTIAEGFRLAYALPFVDSDLHLFFWFRVTEQPYRIPFYATLLYYLSIPTSNEDAGAGEENTTKPPLGRLILDDFWKGFQAYLDKLAWRETRLCVRLTLLVLFVLSVP